MSWHLATVSNSSVLPANIPVRWSFRSSFQPSPRPDLALGPIGSYASGQCPFGSARGEFMHAFERTT